MAPYSGGGGGLASEVPMECWLLSTQPEFGEMELPLNLTHIISFFFSFFFLFFLVSLSI